MIGPVPVTVPVPSWGPGLCLLGLWLGRFGPLGWAFLGRFGGWFLSFPSFGPRPDPCFGPSSFLLWPYGWSLGFPRPRLLRLLLVYDCLAFFGAWAPWSTGTDPWLRCLLWCSGGGRPCAGPTRRPDLSPGPTLTY